MSFDFYQHGKDVAFKWFTGRTSESALKAYRKAVGNTSEPNLTLFKRGFYDEMRRISKMSCEEFDKHLGNLKESKQNET